MRLLLCGGGTAGHINPAIAVAEELTKSCKDSKVLFVGREDGEENQLVSKAGFSFQTIKIQGIKRSLSLENIARIKLAIKAIDSAGEIIKQFKPDVILGTGGYVCWPVITAGRKMGIPIAIHESNIVPGLTTKLLSKKCDLIFLNQEEAKKHLSKKVKTKTVGNPLRQSFVKTTRKEAREKLKIAENEIMILSFGGSIGAERLNDVIVDVIKKYSSTDKKIKHIHAVGKRYYEKIKTEKNDYNGCKILPYIDDMATYMKASDIVICRCGSMTLSEVCEAGASPILIPSPNVTANHQYANGKHLEDLGAAIMIEEKNLSTDTLINAINLLKSEKNGRKTRAKILNGLKSTNASKEIVSELFCLKNRSKKPLF